MRKKGGSGMYTLAKMQKFVLLPKRPKKQEWIFRLELYPKPQINCYIGKKQDCWKGFPEWQKC
jgi:hypothetical protein